MGFDAQADVDVSAAWVEQWEFVVGKTWREASLLALMESSLAEAWLALAAQETLEALEEGF